MTETLTRKNSRELTFSPSERINHNDTFGKQVFALYLLLFL